MTAELEHANADALEHAIADACLGENSGDDLARDLRRFLEARGVSAEDVDAIVAAPHRLAVYRSLVRNGLGAVVARMLPWTRARLNASCAGRFDADVARFLEEVGPRTHYLRDVPHELFAWARPRWAADPHVPAYLTDLAAHELACFAVAAAESRPDVPSPGAVTPDRSHRVRGLGAPPALRLGRPRAAGRRDGDRHSGPSGGRPPRLPRRRARRSLARAHSPRRRDHAATPGGRDASIGDGRRLRGVPHRARCRCRGRGPTPRRPRGAGRLAGWKRAPDCGSRRWSAGRGGAPFGDGADPRDLF